MAPGLSNAEKQYSPVLKYTPARLTGKVFVVSNETGLVFY
jgi:hypothetical protein